MQKIDQKSPHWTRGIVYYLRCLMKGMPRVINLEFTKKCNARCGFCSCWQVESKGELQSYADVIRFFRPVVASISGGEPLMRKDYARLFKEIRPYCHYLVVITNGALLNEKTASNLVQSGVDQICISLDYLDQRHNEARKIKGLSEHLSKIVPHLASHGYRLVLNTVIMKDNLDEIVPIIKRAKEWKVGVSLSSYCPLKMDKDGHMIDDLNIDRLISVVDEIKLLKKKLKNIRNSNHYLDNIVRYFKDGGIPNCKAGVRWLQVAPDGHVQPCSELPKTCHYSEYSKDLFPTPHCRKCWYSCRGEAEANPLEPSRLWELINA